jgi:hypothetical protein
MGIAFRSDIAGGVSVAVWAGSVTRDDIAEHLAALHALPQWGAGGRILTDLTGLAPGLRPTHDELLELRDAFGHDLAERTRAARWAIVASGTFEEAAEFGRQLHDDTRDLTVFFDLPSACIWLGVDLDATRVTIEQLRKIASAGDP